MIEYLDLRGARPPFTYSSTAGATQSYINNAAAIYVEKGEYITVRNCRMHDCGNGFFVASRDGQASSHILVEGNDIFDNGNSGSIYEHNNYTAGIDITFQYNRFGPPRAGCPGNNLSVLDDTDALNLTHNWLKPGWVSTFGSLGGLITNDGSNLTGAAPGFLDPSRALYFLAAGSPCLNAGAALHPAVLPAHFVTRHYQPPCGSVPHPNALALDVGAYEFSPLELWRFATFGSDSTNAAVAGDWADPDGDGAVNFEEFALATDPRQAGARPSSVVGLAGGFLTLTYWRPDPVPPEVAYETGASEDLGSWCWDCTIPLGTATNLATGTATVTVRDSVSTSMAPKRFLRLRLRR